MQLPQNDVVTVNQSKKKQFDKWLKLRQDIDAFSVQLLDFAGL
tara:strand:- start:16493 stop:16621 length:129 start_codon:yes stop_codon:yes gene_type:complete